MNKTTDMITSTLQQTDTNPFTAYRDPVTGRWHVVIPPKSETDSRHPQSEKESSS